MEYFTYIPKGTCSTKIEVALDGDRVADVKFTNGCNGNLKAIPKLVKGMTVDEVVERVAGNTCGMRNTSCADHMAKALVAAKAALS